MDIRQSKYWADYLARLGWEKVDAGKQSAYVRNIIFGSLIKIPRAAAPIPFVEIDKIAREKRAFFVKVELDTNAKNTSLLKTLTSHGFLEDKWSLQPTKTIIINLKASEETLLKNMEKDTRYSIRRAERENVKVEKSDDIKEFLSLHKETAKRKGFWTSKEESKALWESLSADNKQVLFAKKGADILAGAFLIFYDKTAYYYEAASSAKNRELLAPYLLVWESIKLAKNKDCTRFDFEGIADPRIKSTKGWGGFTHFKKGFGGEEVTYPGSFVKYYNPVIKLIFSLNKFF